MHMAVKPELAKRIAGLAVATHRDRKYPRPVIEAINVEWSGAHPNQEVVFVATDSYRLVTYTLSHEDVEGGTAGVVGIDDTDPAGSVLVHGQDFAKALKAAATAAKKDGGVVITMVPTPSRDGLGDVFVAGVPKASEVEGVTTQVRTIEGAYPKWRALFGETEAIPPRLNGDYLADLAKLIGDGEYPVSIETSLDSPGTKPVVVRSNRASDRMVGLLMPVRV